MILAKISVSAGVAVSAVLLVALACFALGAWVARPRWERKFVSPVGRGPFADTFYWRIAVSDGQTYDFTAGAVDQAAKDAKHHDDLAR